MPGIVVGIDGSEHSARVLEWAMREAALRQAQLTVLTVHQVAASYWTGNPVVYPEDRPMQEQARQAAEEAVAKAASQIGDARPPSVTVRAVSGLAARS
jgi:nucleotide-binding universal stress UspA family protein